MINLFLPTKKTFLIIASFGIIIIVLILITSFSTPAPPTLINPSPSPSLSLNNLPDISKSPDNPSTVYSPEDIEKDFQRLESQKPLTSADSQLRAQLISSLQNESGYLEENSSYKIEYVKSPDLFVVEILSENTTQSMNDAIRWFTSKGLSSAGVCDFRLMFYLNYDIAKTLVQKGQTFNPIPENCQ